MICIQQNDCMKAKYTYDFFLEAVKKSGEIKSAFIKKYRRLYEYSRKVGWYNQYPWKTKAIKEGNNYLIYCFEDQEAKAAYIGLTSDIKKRIYQHKNDNSSVKEYFSARNVQIPHPIILETGLSANNAKKMEGYYCDKYRSQGWYLINKAKTGEFSSSIGGGQDKWNYGSCFEKSKQYKTKSEFQRGCVSAYRKSLEMGWLDNWFINAERKKWTRDKCSEEARKYHSRSEFRLSNQSAYNSAWKNGWLDDYYWFRKNKRKRKWNEDSCYAAAKEYCSITEFATKYSAAYKTSRKNGWIKNYTWFEKTSDLLSRRHLKWTYDACYNLALKYKNRWAFGKENSGAYHASLKNKWIDSFIWFEEDNNR